MAFKDSFLTSVKARRMMNQSPDPALLIPNLYLYKEDECEIELRSRFMHLLAGGSLTAETIFSFSFQPLDCALLLYTHEGSGRLDYRGTSASLTGRQLLFFDCSQPFALQSTLLPWRFTLFFISGGYCDYFKETLGAAKAPLFTLPEYSPLLQTLHHLLALPTDVHTAQLLLMQQLLNDLLTPLYLSIHQKSAPRADIPSYLIQMKDRFEHHFQEEFSLDACAEYFSVSKYRLCREFARYFGEPPLRYLSHKRLDEAVKMLLTTEMTVHEISSSVGYENVNHFIQLFKKEYNTTPGAFRQKALADQPAARSPVQ